MGTMERKSPGASVVHPGGQGRACRALPSR
jgi:hypothetical protein